jgi:ribokinase
LVFNPMERETAPAELRYQALIGVGGIGVGRFFALNGSHTLGREESRSGRFLESRDYCKLHIISHYVHILSGSDFHTIMIGRLGDDDWGLALFHEMRRSGLDLHYVTLAPGEQTLFGLCLVYPDGSGGNLMVSDSACSRVDQGCVRRAAPEFERYAGYGIALAVPEVPLDTRLYLLQTAARHRFFRASSLTSEEIRTDIAAQIIALSNLLAINLDEAAALVAAAASSPSAVIVEKSVLHLTDMNKHILISITGGRQGSWFWDGQHILHMPALEVPVIASAGAGDAHLAGILTGIAAGLPLPDTLELARLVAAQSLTSAHTIHPDISRETLFQFMQDLLPEVPHGVAVFLNPEA